MKPSSLLFVPALAGLALSPLMLTATSRGPRPEKLNGLANHVYIQTSIEKDPEAKKSELLDRLKFEYTWEVRLLEAAGVHNADTEQQERAKLQMLWEMYPEKLTADAPNFDVSRGGLLKYAVKMNTWDLLTTAITAWHLNLNRVDRSDERSLIDYLIAERTRNAGRDVESTLRELLRVARIAGGRTKAELDAAIAPLRADYEEVRYFWAGMAAVKKDGKWGFVDESHRLAIPCVYQDVSTFISAGIARVTLDDTTWTYIDKAGKAAKGPWDE